ncbi:unnamed protein product [Polarella glacialis]|uniref:FYVE-type domain-containing protein n=1 Tax=Polarella glacialis TaxID=89957 RepID=A0A813LUQ0_POLGL|nr:unnamed protein product [Polarella glacialis]
MAATTDGASSAAALDDAADTRRGFAEANNCRVCGAQLAKRLLNPRHHCRICGNSVCSTCSPSTVQLEGEKSLQRACTPCVANAQLAHSLKDRLAHLARHLNAIGGAKSPGSDQPTNLEASVIYCEAALTALEDTRDNHEALKTQLQGMKMRVQSETTRASQEFEKRQQLENELLDAHTALELQVNRELETVQQLESSLSDFRCRLEASESRVGILQLQHSAQQRIQQHLEETLGEVRSKLQDTEASALDAKTAADQQVKVREGLESDVEALRREQAAAEQRSKAAQADLRQQKKVLEKLEGDLREACSAHQLLGAQTEAAEKRAEEAEALGRQARDTLEVALRDLGASGADGDQLKLKLESTEKLHAAATLRCSELETEVSQERNALNELETKVRAAQAAASAPNAETGASAVASCRAALAVAESEAKQALQAKLQLEQDVQEARAAILELGERLHGLCRSQACRPKDGSLREAAQFCQSAMPHIEQVAKDLAESQALAARERELRLAAELAVSAASERPADPRLPTARSIGTTSSRSHLMNESLLGDPRGGERQTCVDRSRQQCTAM